MKTRFNIEVEIFNIEVDDRYYSFTYNITVNGKKIIQEEYSDDYCNGDTPEEWKQELKDGYALKQVMALFGENFEQGEYDDYLD